MTGISTKWPAARLSGPSVPRANALEFIRRTDPMLVGDGFTNNRVFQAQVRQMTGFPENPYSADGDWRKQEAYAEAFKRDWGYVQLDHLQSRWVANASISGPAGPVHPDGTVQLGQNFGKWPSTEEVEAELTLVAQNFPWLAFTLCVWGHSEETTEDLPSCAWQLEAGQWRAVDPEQALDRVQVQVADPLEGFIASLTRLNREQTWSMPQIHAMWGTRAEHCRALAATSPESV